MPTGGPIRTVTIDNRSFPGAGDMEPKVKLGGASNELQADAVGPGRVVQEVKAGEATGLKLSIDPKRSDHEFLQEIADSGEVVGITLEYTLGARYFGEGTITGDIEFDNKSTTVELSLGVPKWTKQA